MQKKYVDCFVINLFEPPYKKILILSGNPNSLSFPTGKKAEKSSLVIASLPVIKNEDEGQRLSALNLQIFHPPHAEMQLSFSHKSRLRLGEFAGNLI